MKNKLFKNILRLICIFLVSFNYKFNCYATKITFIVPGKSTEDFWVTSAEFTKVAAEKLGFEYEVLYAERDRQLMIDLTRQVAARENKPDFVLIVNEKQAAPQMIQELDKSNIKTFLVHVDLTDDQKEILKYPRELHKSWLGTIVADNISAGYGIMREIYKSAKEKLKNKKSFNVIAINGDKATKASVERELGLYKFLSEQKDLHLLQSVVAEWDREIAFEKTTHIFRRYKNVDLIWAANDPIALGALKAVKTLPNNTDKNILIGGLNWSQEALQEIKQGNIITSLGGHFMNGACAVLVIFDYINGIDLDRQEYEMKLDLFSPVAKKDVDKFLTYLNKDNWKKINFKNYSKFSNKKIKKYHFSPRKILMDTN